jgi:hypothetical protein
MPFRPTAEGWFTGRTKNGRDMNLVEPLVFFSSDGNYYRAPIAETTDLGSTPTIAWSLGFPPFGDEAPGYVMHDAAYRRKLEVLVSDKWDSPTSLWMPAEFDRAKSDWLLEDCMESLAIDQSRRAIIYDLLRKFGQKAWDQSG